MKIIRKKDFIDWNEECNLHIKDFNGLKVSGWTARLVIALLNSRLKNIITGQLLKLGGINYLRDLQIEDEPCLYPIIDKPDISFDPTNIDQYIKSKENWPYHTIGDYHKAYRDKKITPTEICNNLLDICRKDEIKALNAIVYLRDDTIKDAEASESRYQSDAPLSVIDGIPFFVKEEIKISGYTINIGMDDLSILCDATSTCILNLVNAGAIFMGFTNMVQFGSNPIGINPSKTRPSCRNPFDTSRYTGGSSAGSGVVVAAGLCPFAIGVDGLGSVRIPASVNGLVGIRPTYSRLPIDLLASYKTSPFCTIGPIACCVSDASLIYSFMAPDTDKQNSKSLLPSLNNFDLTNIRFGICNSYIKNSTKEWIDKFNTVLKTLEAKGASKIEINIPELKETLLASTFGLLYGLKDVLNNDYYRNALEKSYDVLLHSCMAVSQKLNEDDLAIINKQRTRTMNIFTEIFDKVDIILLPSLCNTSTPIENTDQVYGFLDAYTTNSYLLFQGISSLSGVPSMVINIGYEENSGIPFSLQLISKWWREDLLINVAHAIEEFFPLTKRPNVYFTPFTSK